VDKVVENSLKAAARPEAPSCRLELVKKASKSLDLTAIKGPPEVRRSAA